MSGDVHLERQVAAKNVEKTSPGASERPPGRAKSRPGGPGRAKKRAKTERKCERVALRIIFCQCERSRSAGQGETQPSEERRRSGHPSPSMRICEWIYSIYIIIYQYRNCSTGWGSTRARDQLGDQLRRGSPWLARSACQRKPQRLAFRLSASMLPASCALERLLMPQI